MPRTPWTLLLRPAGGRREAADFLKSVSLERLSSLERAVRVFYDSSGQYPRSLEDLVVARILSERALEDPYGRPYRYILRSEDGKFGLYGRNAEGSIDLDLSLDRTLAPVAEIRPAGSRSRNSAASAWIKRIFVASAGGGSPEISPLWPEPPPASR